MVKLKNCKSDYVNRCNDAKVRKINDNTKYFTYNLLPRSKIPCSNQFYKINIQNYWCPVNNIKKRLITKTIFLPQKIPNIHNEYSGLYLSYVKNALSKMIHTQHG